MLIKHFHLLNTELVYKEHGEQGVISETVLTVLMRLANDTCTLTLRHLTSPSICPSVCNNSYMKHNTHTCACMKSRKHAWQICCVKKLYCKWQCSVRLLFVRSTGAISVCQTTSLLSMCLNLESSIIIVTLHVCHRKQKK